MAEFTYDNFINKNGTIYNTVNKNAYTQNAIDGQTAGFTGAMGLAELLTGDRNGQIDISKFRSDPNYDPVSNKSGGVYVNPNTGKVDPNFNPAAPMANNFKPGNPNNYVANQTQALQNQIPNNNVITPPTPSPNLAPQINALNTPTTNNGVGNSMSGSQYTPGQVAAGFGNISNPLISQDQQRQAIKTDLNNITGYQDISKI